MAPTSLRSTPPAAARPPVRTTLTYPASTAPAAVHAGIRAALHREGIFRPLLPEAELLALWADSSDLARMAAAVSDRPIGRRSAVVKQAERSAILAAIAEADAEGVRWTPSLDALVADDLFADDGYEHKHLPSTPSARLAALQPWFDGWTAEDAEAALCVFRSAAFLRAARQRAHLAWATADHPLVGWLAPSDRRDDKREALRELIQNPTLPQETAEGLVLAVLRHHLHEGTLAADTRHAIGTLLATVRARTSGGFRASFRAALDTLTRAPRPAPRFGSTVGVARASETQGLIRHAILEDPACEREVLQAWVLDPGADHTARVAALLNAQWSADDRAALAAQLSVQARCRLAPSLLHQPATALPWSVIGDYAETVGAADPIARTLLKREDCPDHFLRRLARAADPSSRDLRAALARNARARALPEIYDQLYASSAIDVMMPLLEAAEGDDWLALFKRVLAKDPRAAIDHLVAEGAPGGLVVPASWIAPYVGCGTPEQNAQVILALGHCSADPVTPVRPPRRARPRR